MRKILNGFDVVSHLELLLFTKMLHMTYLIIFIASISLWRLYKWNKIYFYRLRLMSLHRNTFQSSMRNSNFLLMVYMIIFTIVFDTFYWRLYNRTRIFWIRITTIFQSMKIIILTNWVLVEIIKSTTRVIKIFPPLNTLQRIAIYRNVDLFPIKHPGINCATQNLTKAVRVCH